MELTTPRLLLREFVPGDWPAVLAYQSDPRYLRYYEWTERTPAAVQAFVQRFVEQQREQPRTRYQFALVLPGDGSLIGNCGIRRRSPGAHEADIGYELDPAQWGRGYATEAASAVLAFGFEQLGLHRVWAECLSENVASAHVLEKLELQREARLRENVWMKGRYWDTLIYAILAPEWRAAHRAGG
jgi:RimJ/RimL family protein N-acetyltransferase